MTDARLLGGRYELGPVLGYGGMAEVHHGRDHRLGRDVAIKVLRSDLARDPGFQARFRREAQNAASLNHPAIVSVYDTGEQSTGGNEDLAVPFIVMEYVEGQTLKEVLTDEIRLMPERALEITADICAALDFSHEHGIIHRDIKPGNVMLASTGTVKVMDFGIARAISSASASMTATSAVIGTAQYLSPEQARGESVDARSDVYSTGCLLYELLVGEPPFTGDNPVSVAYQHVREDPVPPGERVSGIPPEVDAIVLKAMAKNPANRYQSAAEMRADLLRAVAGRPVSAEPVMPSNERTAVLGGGGYGGGGYGGGYGNDGYGNTQGRPITQPPRKGKGTGIAIAVLAVLALLAVVAFVVTQLRSDDSTLVAVPDLKDKSITQARLLLSAKKFKIKEVPVESSAKQKNVVIDYSPSGDAPSGSTIRLEVGNGPNQVTVPKIPSGTKLQGAQQILERADLKVHVIYKDSDRPEDEVLSIEPATGQTVAARTTISVTVSKGNRITVPQVTGVSEAEAIRRLTAEGFISKVQRVANALPVGQVIAQNPAQNVAKARGTTVTITVSTGPAGGVVTSAPPNDPGDGDDPGDDPPVVPPDPVTPSVSVPVPDDPVPVTSEPPVGGLPEPPAPIVPKKKVTD
jgi:serine/threonine-protein kinase